VSPNPDNVRSAAEPSVSSNSNNHISSSDNKDLIPAIPQYGEPFSADDNGRNGISSSDLLSSPPSEYRQNPSFDSKCEVLHSCQPSLTDNDVVTSSPSFDNELGISTTSSNEMQSSNYRHLKNQEFSILFDDKGEMHKNLPLENSNNKNRQIIDEKLARLNACRLNPNCNYYLKLYT